MGLACSDFWQDSDISILRDVHLDNESTSTEL